MTQPSKDQPKPFDANVHHPVVEVIKHVTSPLSVALFAFGFAKYNMRHQYKAWRLARAIRRSNPGTAAAASPRQPHAAHHAHVPPHQQRSFSTAARNTGNSPMFVTPTRHRLAAAMVPASAALFASGRRNFSTAHAARGPEPIGDHGDSFHNVERMMGYWQEADLPEVMHHIWDLPSVVAFEKGLLTIHESFGLPWWGTLICSTLLMRTAVLPFNILLLRNQLRVKLLRRDTDELAAVMSSDSTTPAEKVAAANQVDRLFKEKGCHPLFMWDWVIPLGFPPVFLSYFCSINNLCLGEGTMRTGGTLWFYDLMAPDATSLLPIISAVSWLAVVEGSAGQAYLQSNYVKLYTRLGAVAMIPLTCSIPAGVFCFWVTSNIWEILRLRIFQNDGVRDFFGIPRLSQLPPVPPTTW